MLERTMIMTWLLGCLSGSTLLAADGLEKGFADPPESAKPWIYWWWLDSNASKEGISRDLEEMKRQGLGGALVFDAGAGCSASRKAVLPAWVGKGYGHWAMLEDETASRECLR